MPLDLESVRARFPGRAIYWHATLPSTMPEAARLADEGAPHGTVTGADEQTAGQGRYERRWHSESESGLYQTVILRLPKTPPVITLTLGLAAAKAIEQAAGVAADLRWPNDVLIGGRKTAGILVQLHNGAVLAGIGINVNQAEFPPEIAAIATSLRQASGRTHSREDLLAALLAEIDKHCEILSTQGPSPILDMFTHASTYVAGRRVIVDDHLRGTTAGLTPEGFLKLRRENGAEQVILAGGVRPCS